MDEVLTKLTSRTVTLLQKSPEERFQIVEREICPKNGRSVDKVDVENGDFAVKVTRRKIPDCRKRLRAQNNVALN